MESRPACSVDDCERPNYSRGFCRMHYSRWKRHGDPIVVASSAHSARPLSERFWEKVDKDGPVPQHVLGQCWKWSAAVSIGGYGVIGRGRADEGMTYAHRVSWEIHNGPIPDGYYVLHHCDNPPCCNPAHLFLGTYGDNNRDARQKGRNQAAINAAKTHCPKGHLYDEENTYVWSSETRTPSRRCRACLKERREMRG